MVSLTKQSNIKAFLELFISVFRLTCELILGAHVGIVLIVVIPVLLRFLRTMEKTLNVLYSTGTILLLYAPNTRTVHNRKLTSKMGKMSTVSQINFTEFWSVFISIFYIFAIIANGCIL